MSYKLKAPYTEIENADFIVLHNHKNGLKIENGSDTYENGKLTFKGEFLFALADNEIMSDVEVKIDVPDEIEEGQEQTYHKETVTVHKPIINPNYEKEQEEKEKERIAKLSLTKREVFLALYKAKKVTPEMLKTQIGENVEALIEFEYAEKYYRFNPLIDTIGGMLGYSSADLDYLFINKELPEVESELEDA